MKQLMDMSISSYDLARTIGVSASAVRAARLRCFKNDHFRKVNKKWRKDNMHKQNEINRNYRARSLKNAQNLGDEWSAQEDLLILTSTLKGLQLAEFLGRTLDSIYVRRNRLKKRAIHPVIEHEHVE